MKYSAFALICLKTVESITAPLVKNGLTKSVLVTLLGTTAATLVGFGKSATAQTIYPFDTVYDVQQVLTSIPGTDLFDALVSGFNPNAPYGLTNYTVRSYVRANLNTGVIAFNTDPVQFGLKDFPLGSVVYSGSGNDKLLGTSSGTSVIDFTIGRISGTTNEIITGGTGRFSGATGIINVFESEPIPEDPTATTLRGRAFSSGSFATPQKVPEPTTTTALIGIGLIGAALLLRQHHLKSTV